MNLEEKKEFIDALVTTVKAELMQKAEAMPGNWDGLEIRQYIADKFGECVWGDMSPKRLAEYHNSLYVIPKL